MTVSPAHPYLGPGSICLLCQTRVALPYGHLCRLCDTTVADEQHPPACVAPLRCYCALHLGKPQPPAPPAAESAQEARDVLARRRALVEAGYTRNQRQIIAARERNAQ